MKILGLKSIIKIGTNSYVVEKIRPTGVTIKDLTKSSRTTYQLSDITENLILGTMKVEKI